MTWGIPSGPGLFWRRRTEKKRNFAVNAVFEN